ncbi:MAG: conjugal transfer protein TraH, partial [Mariprofundaceae bacterium]
KIEYKPPTKLKIEQMVNGTGGVAAAEVYRCNTISDPDCLNPSVTKISLEGYKKQVQAALDNVRNALTSERLGGVPVALPVSSRKLLTLTRLPVLKMMATAGAIGPSVVLQVENELIEPVAFDLVALYLEWAYRSAEDAARQVGGTAPKELWGALMASVTERTREFRALKKNKTILAATKILEEARFLDQVLVSQMNPHLREVLQYARAH